MLIDDMKKRLGAAIKAQNEVEREMLRLALGEVQTLEARHGRPPTDDEAFQVIRKLVKSAEETRALTTDEAKGATLVKEIAVLTSLLPKGLSIEEIAGKLAPVRDAIRAAGNEGQATGIAVKHLKGQGLSAPGGDVAQAVKALRA